MESYDSFREFLDDDSTEIRIGDLDQMPTDHTPRYSFAIVGERSNRPSKLIRLETKDQEGHERHLKKTLSVLDTDLKVLAGLDSDGIFEDGYTVFDLEGADRRALEERLVEVPSYPVDADDITLRTVEAVADALETADFVGTDASMDVALGEQVVYNPHGEDKVGTGVDHTVYQLHADHRHGNNDEPVFLNDRAFVSRQVKPHDFKTFFEDNPRELSFFLEAQPEILARDINESDYNDLGPASDTDKMAESLVHHVLSDDEDDRLTVNHIADVIEAEPAVAATVILYSDGALEPNHPRSGGEVSGQDIIERCENVVESHTEQTEVTMGM